MEAFSLLKYWRAAATGGATTTTTLHRTSTPTTTISSTAVSHSTSQTDDDDDDEENGPFFDLEFALEDHDKPKSSNRPDEEGEEEDEDSDGTEAENEEREDGEEEGEFKFTLQPSDELFFKGDLVPVEASAAAEEVSGGQGGKPPQFSLLKSASKFGVLMLKLKKSRPPGAGETAESGGDSVCLAKQSGKEAVEQTQKQKPSQSKLFAVKFKVEEVPIVSLFTRDNSSRGSSATINKSLKKEAPDESCPEEKRVSKDGVQKYLKMVKPLYIRVSKRHSEKAGFSGQLSVHSPPHSEATKSEKTEAAMKPELPAEAEEKSGKQGKLLSAGLRVVGKHLGKSRSASSAAVAAAPVSVAAVGRQGRRRDDSLLEQQDGIQSAILHCKRSFNLSRDLESTLLSRSVSDPSPKNP